METEEIKDILQIRVNIELLSKEIEILSKEFLSEVDKLKKYQALCDHRYPNKSSAISEDVCDICGINVGESNAGATAN